MLGGKPDPAQTNREPEIKENKTDSEAMSQQIEALKDHIQVLTTKLQDGNALNDKFNVLKEEKEAMSQHISTQQHKSHELNETVKELEVFEQKYYEF